MLWLQDLVVVVGRVVCLAQLVVEIAAVALAVGRSACTATVLLHSHISG